MKPYYQDSAVTIYHGDCRESIEWRCAEQVVVSDPPYGIGFSSGWTGVKISGDTNNEERDYLLRWRLGRPAIVFGPAGEARLEGSEATLVWHRPGSGMGDLAFPWKPDYELIHVFGKGFASNYRGPSVLSFPWDTFRGDAGHPHRKPIALMKSLIAACPAGEIVDPFCGTGSTLRAAKDLGRRAIGIEIEERYCEIAARRCAQEVLDLAPQPELIRELTKDLLE